MLAPLVGAIRSGCQFLAQPHRLVAFTKQFLDPGIRWCRAVSKLFDYGLQIGIIQAPIGVGLDDMTIMASTTFSSSANVVARG